MSKTDSLQGPVGIKGAAPDEPLSERFSYSSVLIKLVLKLEVNKSK